MRMLRWGIALVLLLVTVPLLIAVQISSARTLEVSQPLPTPAGSIATEEQLAMAREAWAQSAHSSTFDDGLGANTTCARCKAPLNWDPSQSLAQQEALDCASCKRTPGAPRPELASGVPVTLADWQNIGCEVCHRPADDSYTTDIAYWNQALQQYETVESVDDLCAKCHEGRHGFRVIEELGASEIHSGMTCTECHGSHGQASRCSDCHDPALSSGAAEHARHPDVNCTGCHDAGGLSIWYETEPSSKHYGEYITIRFAHALTSWPSHNLTTTIDCTRCHHPLEDRGPVLVQGVACTDCHEHEYGAVSGWCTFFTRDPDPNADQSDEP